MMEYLKNLLRTGVNKGTDDSGKIRRSKSFYQGKPNNQTVESLVMFGTFGCPQEGTEDILLQRKCNESGVASIPCDPVNRIKKDCSPGEFGVGNPITGAYTYFKKNGEIESKTEDMTVVFTPGGKISITGSSDELISVIDEWMTTMISAKVLTSIGPQPFTADTITNLTAVQAKFQGFKV